MKAHSRDLCFAPNRGCCLGAEMAAAGRRDWFDGTVNDCCRKGPPGAFDPEATFAVLFSLPPKLPAMSRAPVKAYRSSRLRSR